MRKIKVSICMPVYNAEQFVRKTMESIIEQTLIEKEVIVVNDGSVDNTWKIIKEYSEKYDYIKCINQENQGVSIARQTAVKYASGEYIGFVDADDTIESTMYSKMYELAVNKGADIVECRASRGNQLYNDYPPIETSGVEKIYDYFLNNCLKNPLWLRICKSELYSDNIFPNFRLNNEDVFVFPCLLLHAKKYIVMNENEILYHYSDDNELGVVNTMRTHDLSGYKKSLLLVKAPLHIEHYMGGNYRKVFLSEEFTIYKGHFFDRVLGYPYSEKSYTDKIKDIMDEGGYNYTEIKRSVFRYLKNSSLKRYLFARVFGCDRLYSIVTKKELVK